MANRAGVRGASGSGDRRLAGDHVEVVVGRDPASCGLGGDVPAMLGGGR
jgi:hypothetical protein